MKNVSGYNMHRLLTGSLGTLGAIVQVAMKLRPLPAARRTVRFAGGLDTARALLEAVPTPAGVLATPDVVELRLEGWPEQIEAEARTAAKVAEPIDASDEAPFPSERPWEDQPIVAEVAVPPSKLPDVLAVAGDAWGALAGVGLAWVGLESPDGPLDALRARARAAGGIAPVVKGPGGLGADVPPALEIHRRLKAVFDPAGVLAPGRFWGGI